MIVSTGNDRNPTNARIVGALRADECLNLKGHPSVNSEGNLAQMVAPRENPSVVAPAKQKIYMWVDSTSLARHSEETQTPQKNFIPFFYVFKISCENFHNGFVLGGRT